MRRPVTAADPAVDLAAAQAAAHDLRVALGADLADVGVRDTWRG